MYAIFAHHMEGISDMHHTKMLAVCIGLFSLLMTGLGSDMESKAIKAIKSGYSHGSYASMAEDSKEDKIEIVRDRFMMFLVGGGAFAGAMVCVILRRVWAKEANEKTKEMMAAHFVVSFFSALFCIPASLKYYFKTGSPEMAFLCSFLGAVVVWGVWEIVFAIVARFKKAAIDRGIAGVREEITGNSQVVTSVPAKPEATPQVPVGDKPS